MKRAKSILWLFPYSIRRLIVRTVRPNFYNTLQNMRTVETSSGYSFKPFDENKCIFVHIPKSAGVSVSRALFGNLAGGHAGINRYQIIFSQYEFDTYFKFTYVRNPWDRLVSAFHFFKEGGMAKPDRIFAEKHLSAYHDFEDFVRRGLKENIEATHFIPQYRFVCDFGGVQPRVDFVGLYENLREDFNYIKDRLDISVNLKHQNKTSNRKKDYRDYYTDETREIVANVYQKDIEIFGYDFDNSSLANQLTRRSAILSNAKR